MKRIATAILAVSAAALIAAPVAAQDLLVLRNGTSLYVKTLEISKKQIKYLRYQTEAPVYTLPVSDIDYIEYPNGDRDTFGKGQTLVQRSAAPARKAEQPIPAAAAPAPASAATATHAPATPATAPAEQAETVRYVRQYQTGDIFSEGEIAGIVISTTDNGAHGTICSLDEACLEWSSVQRRSAKPTGAGSRHDGMENMSSLAGFIAAEGLSWSDFPAFEWCRAKGEGWYLPSLNEIWQLGTIFNGGSRTSPDKAKRRKFNDTLRNSGGKPLNNMMLYHSSTEASDARNAWYSHLGTDKPYTGEGSKSDKLFIRAFYRF